MIKTSFHFYCFQELPTHKLFNVATETWEIPAFSRHKPHPEGSPELTR